MKRKHEVEIVLEKKTRLTTKLFVIGSSLITIFLLITTVFLFTSNKSHSLTKTSAITQESDRQIITIQAKNGFSPKSITAEANKPTLLKITTNNTYDCTSEIKIPDLNFSKILPPSGTTELEIPAQKTTSVVRGFCGMGMYSFDIKFI